jgi:hypothetical protein
MKRSILQVAMAHSALVSNRNTERAILHCELAGIVRFLRVEEDHIRFRENRPYDELSPYDKMITPLSSFRSELFGMYLRGESFSRN